MNQLTVIDAEQSTVTVVDGKLSDIENFDDLSLSAY